MGEMNSGVSRGTSARDTTERQHSIDMAYLNRQNLLQPGSVGLLSWTCRDRQKGSIGYRVEADALLLRYKVDAEQFEYRVDFERTPCHFGGTRTWLLCPNMRCGRRVRILYGGRLFLCRHCHDLAYPSTRERGIDLHLRRAGRIRERLGWRPGVIYGIGTRPKGMHWSTYYRLIGEYERHFYRLADVVSVQMHALGPCGRRPPVPVRPRPPRRATRRAKSGTPTHTA